MISEDTWAYHLSYSIAIKPESYLSKTLVFVNPTSSFSKIRQKRFIKVVLPVYS